MSRALLDDWRVHEFAAGLYPERRDVKDGRLDRFIGSLHGRWAQGGSPRRGHRLRRFAGRVEALAEALSELDEDALRRRVAAVRAALMVDGLADAPVAECFALIREVCSRQLGLRHYPVQLMGGYAMLRGTLAEMQTGEGKTLTAVLPAVTVALAGAPLRRLRRGARRCLDRDRRGGTAAAGSGGAQRAGGRWTRRRAGRRVFRPDP